MTKSNDKTKRIYYVQGMHCASCEVLIQKELIKISGVDKANVSLNKNCVVLDSEKRQFPEVNKLNELMKDLGYKFSLERPKEVKLKFTEISKVLAVFILFLVAFLALERSGFFLKYSVTSNSSVAAYFIFGIVAGLSSCAALVGGLLLSLSGQWNTLYNGNTKKSFLPFIYFNGARILTFAFLGGLLGLLGSYITFSISFSTAISLIIAVVMLILGFQMLDVAIFKKIRFAAPKSFTGYISDEKNFKGKYMPVLVGALTFFVPCGFTLIAQTNAINSGSFFRGALMLTAFALGTLPILVLISFSSVKFYTNKNFSKKFNLFSGLLIVFFALYTMNSQLNVLGWYSLSDISSLFKKSSEVESTQARIIGDVQYMQMEAIEFDYYPKKFKLKAGVKTKWDIYNSGAVGCAQAVYARGLYPDVIYLKPGLNSVEFTPNTPGTYKISCSMGMVPPITVNVY